MTQKSFKSIQTPVNSAMLKFLIKEISPSLCLICKSFNKNLRFSYFCEGERTALLFFEMFVGVHESHKEKNVELITTIIKRVYINEISNVTTVTINDFKMPTEERGKITREKKKQEAAKGCNSIQTFQQDKVISS